MSNKYDFTGIYKILQILDLGVAYWCLQLNNLIHSIQGHHFKSLFQRLKQLTYLYFSFCVLTRMFFKTMFFVYSLPGSHPCQVSLLTTSTP